MSRVATAGQSGRDPAGPGGLGWRLARLEDENSALRDEQQRLEREHQRLEAEGERLRGENERLRAERERLQEINQRLRGEVEALRRAAKRQAAPFSKGDPVPNPKRSGRKPGAAYGTRAHRRPPEHVDQVVVVGLPGCCPGCGGELTLERVAIQHVEELPPARPLVTRFEVQVGRCCACGRRVQPRHPAQTSDALGAAGPSLVPGRWRWRPGSARGWGCRRARSPGCLASSASRSPLVGSSRQSPAPVGHASRPTRP
jgi:hypothetical protein